MVITPSYLYRYVSFIEFRTVHKNVHKGLVRKVNEEINVVMERGRSTLRLNELHVLPMLFREKRAASRNFRSTEESYFKYFNAN